MCGKNSNAKSKTEKVRELMLFSWREATLDFKQSIEKGATHEEMYREAYWRGVQDALKRAEPCE